jgi:heat shock protein HslJ
VTGFRGCNNLTGSYKLNGDELAIRPIAAKRLACIQGMEIEGAFVKTLKGVRRWKFLGQHFELYDAGGNLVARFEAQALK